jgi:hypothetical protein
MGVITQPGPTADIPRYMMLVRSNFTKAQTEAMVEPHGVTDNLGWKTMLLVADGFCRHTGECVENQLT